MDAQAIIKALGGVPAVVAATGENRSTVHYWGRRDSIPARHWSSLLQRAANVPGCGVTMDVLVQHAAIVRAA